MTSGIALLIALLSPIEIDESAVVSEAPVVAARLEVRAAPGCTSPTDIVARVASRSPRIHFVDGNAALTVAVTFTTIRSGGVSGELVVAGPGGNALFRRFVADSCAEAADAVALIISVTLDPTSPSDGRVTAAEHAPVAAPAATRVGASPQPSLVAATLATSDASPTGAIPTGRSVELVKQPAPAAVPPPEVALTPVLPATKPRHVAAHLAGQAVLGPAPVVMPGIGLDAIGALERNSIWSPAIILGAIHAWRGGLVETGGTASFTLDAATLDVCAVRVRLSVVESRACASGLIGRLLSSGSGTSNPASNARPFAVAGASAILTAGLGSAIEVSARVGAGVTLVRDWYLFTPTVFHRADPWTFNLGLGLGVRLP